MILDKETGYKYPFTIPELEMLHRRFYGGVLKATFWNKGSDSRAVLDRSQFESVVDDSVPWGPIAGRLFDYTNRWYAHGMTFAAFTELLALVCHGGIDLRYVYVGVVWV